MSTQTLTQLRTALASMWGFAFDDLDASDQTDIDGWINGAYFACYAPVKGKRASWTEKHMSERVLAPVSVSLGVTEGSTAVTGYVFQAKYAGSFVQIGVKFFRFAGISDGPVYHLVEPWDGTTGTQAATVFFNAFALSADVQEVCELPSVLGVGPLTPIPSPQAEVSVRSAPGFDFHPRMGRAPFAYNRPVFNHSLFTDVGPPVFYHVDSASVAPDGSLSKRFHCYPLPDAAYTVDFRASRVPPALTTGSDVPKLPLEAVNEILLPIAREELAMNTTGRRYTGNNVALLIKKADQARQQLARLARPQRSQHQTAGLAPGY